MIPKSTKQEAARLKDEMAKEKLLTSISQQLVEYWRLYGLCEVEKRQKLPFDGEWREGYIVSVKSSQDVLRNAFNVHGRGIAEQDAYFELEEVVAWKIKLETRIMIREKRARAAC